MYPKAEEHLEIMLVSCSEEVPYVAQLVRYLGHCGEMRWPLKNSNCAIFPSRIFQRVGRGKQWDSFGSGIFVLNSVTGPCNGRVWLPF